MIIKRLGFAIGLAALFLLAAAGLRYAAGSGMLAEETATRVIMALTGLGLAAYANIMPKQLGRARRSPAAEARAQSALRFGGWALTLAGLAYAFLWGFAPLSIARAAAMTVLGAATLATMTYAIWSFTLCREAGDASASR
ncbi:MAG TPA: hypothetical protein VIT45_06225 [Allosphingosinicella sp.]